MLKALVIKDFALIDRLELAFGPGLSCLTGETGAGKSILVDAISVALGARAGHGVIRDGSDAVVEAAFDVSGLPEVKARLAELGMDDGDELIIRRTLSSGGRGRAYINGSLANIGALQEIGDRLVDIHGQSEHQSLLKVETHLLAVDAYLGLTEDRRAYRDTYDALGALRKKASELAGQERERARRTDLLNFEIDEIDSAELKDGEEDDLKREKARLAHADRLKALVAEALDALSGSEPSAVVLLGQGLKAAREIASVDQDMADCAALVESARLQLGEATATLRDYTDGLDADPERLDAVMGRLDVISSLKKKYGETVEEILRFRDGAAAELETLKATSDESESLEAAIVEAEANVNGKARVLTEARLGGSAGLASRVQDELKGLGMLNARFEVGIEPLGSPGPNGSERAEFMFSANIGERPRPLGKIASGGELSRVMLALKVTLAGADGTPTLIFDEVDTGVGGVTAVTVGRKLKEAATGRQVLCVTHLPQVASFAGAHYLVEKRVEGGRTLVGVRTLDRKGRVSEVARMLGGEGSEAASAHASELVEQGEIHG